MSSSATPRLIALDVARTLALVAMVSFHVTFDLALFDLIPVETLYQPFWHYYPRMIAGSLSRISFSTRNRSLLTGAP